MSNVAVVFAGGTGQRMNTRTRPKQFLELHGKPIIIYTLEAFEEHSEIDGIIVVMLESWIGYTQELIRKYNLEKIKKVVPGGSSGQESIYNGLCAASEFYKDDDIVLIHDGVRPLIDEETITAMSAAALTGKLLQLSNGAVYDENRAVHPVHECKIEALREMVEALRERGKSALIFYQFQHDRDRILEMLNSMPRITAYTLDGPDAIEAWNAGEVDALLAHPASSAYGLNLQEGGHHIIWFGLTWNYEQYVQANARLHRQGQTEPVIVHHLVSQGTRDADVMKALEHKDQAQQYVLDSLKARIREIRKGAK